MAHPVQGPAPQGFRAPAIAKIARPQARHFHANPIAGRRLEQAGPRAAPRPAPHSRAGKKPATRVHALRDVLERHLLQTSAALFLVGAVGWCCLIVNELRSTVFVQPPDAVYKAAGSGGVGKSDALAMSSYQPTVPQRPIVPPDANVAGLDSPAAIVAREWGRLELVRAAERGRTAVKQAARPSVARPPVRLASLESPPPVPAAPSRAPSGMNAETALVDFETAPFPYHGPMPGSNRPFLNVNKDGRLGHTTFRGQVLWEADTFSDDRVLLHIPPGFDPRRPAVMVVFFHGHGANLARDVRDRQKLPAQITAAGMNAVLVAPQFAVDAADSSAGKFWEPNGFKRFLDEAAVKLARLYDDPRAAATFARMPIVIVAYSGGFGPTLSVLDRGGVRSRIRGIVLLDALYGGIDKFADWIAENRATFFVSSYTPHTAHHNADLERLLRDRGVSYSAQLRPNHLPGMVAFLPAGDVSHRDFVTHAWANNPVEDVLTRMSDVSPIEGVETTASISPGATAATRN